MIVVTGSNGFIGSNLIRGLNDLGIKDIIAVDDHANPETVQNIAHLEIEESYEIDEFLDLLSSNKLNSKGIKAIFHQGACSDTMEWDVDYLYRNNLLYSKELLKLAKNIKCQFIYASSASVYGSGNKFEEGLANENPINLYAYSKFKFDQLIRKELIRNKAQIVGLRYFNVYGPHEQHKGKMASVAFHLHNQLKTNNKIKLFEGSDGYDNGEQRRDFVYVNDVVKVNLWFLENKEISGIFNLGTGKSQTFNDVALAVINWNKKGEIQYVKFPDNLKGAYQSFTEADISSLRSVGYKEQFLDVNEGVNDYLNKLESWPKNEPN